MSLELLISVLSGGGSGSGGSGGGDGDYFEPMSGTVIFEDEHFQAALPSYNKASGLYKARNTASFVEFRTSETSMSVRIAGDWASHGTESDIEILVDGVYNQSVRVTTADTLQDIAITLSGGEKLVRIVNGYTANTGDVNTPADGVWVQGVITTGDIEIKVPAIPTNKWVFVGDSITTGASGTHPSVTGYVGLIRDEVAADDIEVAVDSWGGRVFQTSDSTIGTTMATQVAAQLNGTETNEAFILLGTNNFGLLNDTKAFFKLYYQNFIDALHTLKPSAIVWCISILDRTNYTSGNTGGYTGEDYTDAIQELVATRSSWAKFIYGKDLMTLANAPDGVHPNQTGMLEIKTNLLAERAAQL